jgi:hypothetical protein
MGACAGADTGMGAGIKGRCVVPEGSTREWFLCPHCMGPSLHVGDEALIPMKQVLGALELHVEGQAVCSAAHVISCSQLRYRLLPVDTCRPREYDPSRRALVIGVDLLEGVGRGHASSCVSGAQGMSVALAHASFNTELVTNVDASQFRSAVSSFAASLEGMPSTGVAVFHYVGDGVTLGGRQFLCPLGFTEQGFWETAVPLTWVGDEIADRFDGTVCIFVDCGRAKAGPTDVAPPSDSSRSVRSLRSVRWAWHLSSAAHRPT